MDEASRLTFQNAALELLGRERYAALLALTYKVRNRGRLLYWHPEFMAQIAAKTFRRFAGVEDFLAAFEGAEAPPPPPPAPPPEVDWSGGGEFDPRAEPFSNAAFETNLSSTHVRAPLEETALALARLVGAEAHHKNAAGREVELLARSYLVLRYPYTKWATVLAYDDNSQLAEAKALSELLKTEVIAYAGSDTAGCYGYDLFRRGKRVETYYDGEDGSRFRSTFRDESWTGEWGQFEYLNAFFRDRGAVELGFKFADCLGARIWQLDAGARVTLPGSDDWLGRFDWVAARR